MTAAPDTEIGRHLQDMHGKDIIGEWRHAPDQWRQNALSESSLADRHELLHEMDEWNDAAERHDHE